MQRGGPVQLAKKFGDNLSIDRELLQGLSQRSDITKFLFRITTVCVIRVEEGGAEGKD